MTRQFLSSADISFDPCRIQVVDNLLFVFYSSDNSPEYDSYTIFTYDVSDYGSGYFQSWNGEPGNGDLLEVGLISEEEYDFRLQKEEKERDEQLHQIEMDKLFQVIRKYPVESYQFLNELLVDEEASDEAV